MNRQQTIEAAYKIPGEHWPVELGWLWDRFGASRRHAEVGCFCGKSLFVTALAMKQPSEVVAVEPFMLSTEAGFVEPYSGWVEAQLTLSIRAIRHQRPVTSVRHIQATSIVAARMLYEEGPLFDSVYIDANHNYAECKADIEAWLPLVKPGGLIAGHDYWSTNPGVMEAAQEVLADRVQVERFDCRIWWCEV